MSEMSRLEELTYRVLEARPKVSVVPDPRTPEQQTQGARREHERYAMQGNVTLFDDSGQLMFRARLADISAGGMAFYAPRVLQEHSYISFEVSTPFFTQRGKAFVVRHDKATGRWGVRFLQLSETDRQRIGAALQHAAALA